MDDKDDKNRVTFPIVDSTGKIIAQERRQGERRNWKGRPAFPIKVKEGDLVTSNRRRKVDRRVKRTDVVEDPAGPRLPKILLDTGEAFYEILDEGGDITLGRSPTCDVTFDLNYASRQHARIFCEGGRFFIEDSSRNGTSIRPEGGTAVNLKEGRLELVGRGVLRLGKLVEDTAFDLVRYAVIRSL